MKKKKKTLCPLGFYENSGKLNTNFNPNDDIINSS